MRGTAGDAGSFGRHQPRIGCRVNAIDLLQWPAMAATLAAAWAVGSRSSRRRKIGFWVFIVSNALWVAWGVQARAWALVILQIGLFALNLRGARKNDQSQSAEMESTL